MAISINGKGRKEQKERPDVFIHSVPHAVTVMHVLLSSGGTAGAVRICTLAIIFLLLLWT